MYKMIFEPKSELYGLNSQDKMRGPVYAIDNKPWRLWIGKNGDWQVGESTFYGNRNPQLYTGIAGTFRNLMN